MIYAITFDLWNTIFANKFYSKQRLDILYSFLQSREIYVPFEVLKNAFNTKFHLYNVTLKSLNYQHVYTDERIYRVFEEIDVEIPSPDIKLLQKDLESVMLEDPPLLKTGAKKSLEILSSDFKIGLISNTGITPGPILSKVLEWYGLIDLFDIIIYSDETGVYKPHPKMFEIPLKKFNCKGSNAIHIGDSLATDIKGAQELNMLTIWINDSDYPQMLEIRPDYQIKEISEMIQIIRSLSRE
ncbi:MAG: HAD family hydrolase [Candidatus Thorarchaeota archaeon]